MDVFLFIIITLLVLYVLYKMYNTHELNKQIDYVQQDQEEKNTSIPETNYTYMPYRKANLLTKTEYTFFVILVKETLKRRLLVCPKVRLEDIA